MGDEPTVGPVTRSCEDWNTVVEVIVLITGDPMYGDLQKGEEVDITGVFKPPELTEDTGDSKEVAIGKQTSANAG